MNLKEKVALITGGGSGIGKATAKLLASYGAEVVILDINKNRINIAEKEILSLGLKADSYIVDITDSKQIRTAVKNIINTHGKIDILINSAGIISTDKLVDAEEEDWERVMNINAKGTFLCCQIVVKEMIKKRYGKIINLSSIASKTAEYANSIYCASKAAVNMISQTLALEVAEYNINVNAVCPSYTDTEMMQNVYTNRGPVEGMTPKEYEEELLFNVPLGRMAKPTEVGELIAFLASDKSDFITGVTYVISGGKELH